MGLTPGKLTILGKWAFTRQATSVAIDVTHRCNLKCAHCYWWKQEHPEELDPGRMTALMLTLRARGLRAAILYGGEPTLRLELCREAGRIFDTTLVFTNGTNGFPELNNAQWILSLDGPRETNDAVRGPGVYDTAVGNLRKASRPPIVHMTITRRNQDSVEEFIREMLALPVKGIGFSFYTPDVHADDGSFFVPLRERDRLAARLVSFRRRYGEKVGFTRAMARQVNTHGAFSEWNSPSTCPVSRRVLCFASDGSRKRCTYGDGADCSRCGCAAVVAYRGALKPPDYRTLRLILGLMVPEYEARRRLPGGHAKRFAAERRP
jgi:Fe-coproporphyrin III synthase